MLPYDDSDDSFDDSTDSDVRRTRPRGRFIQIDSTFNGRSPQNNGVPATVCT
jgi:hypothetical protein